MNEIQENPGSLEKLKPGFDQMREAQLADPMPGLETRRDRLQRLLKGLEEREEAFTQKPIVEVLKKSNILDWVKESQNIADSIYVDAKENSNLGFEYRYKYLNTVKSRLLMGGLRLAYVLNSIFI